MGSTASHHQFQELSQPVERLSAGHEDRRPSRTRTAAVTPSAISGRAVARDAACSSCARSSSGPPPPRPPQDHRQPRHRGRHRQQLLDALPPPLAVCHVRRDLVHEALAVLGGGAGRGDEARRIAAVRSSRAFAHVEPAREPVCCVEQALLVCVHVVDLDPAQLTTARLHRCHLDTLWRHPRRVSWWQAMRPAPGRVRDYREALDPGRDPGRLGRPARDAALRLLGRRRSVRPAAATDRWCVRAWASGRLRSDEPSPRVLARR